MIMRKPGMPKQKLQQMTRNEEGENQPSRLRTQLLFLKSM